MGRITLNVGQTEKTMVKTVKVANEGGDGKVVFTDVWERPNIDLQDVGKGWGPPNSNFGRVFECSVRDRRRSALREGAWMLAERATATGRRRLGLGIWAHNLLKIVELIERCSFPLVHRGTKRRLNRRQRQNPSTGGNPS